MKMFSHRHLGLGRQIDRRFCTVCFPENLEEEERLPPKRDLSRAVMLGCPPVGNLSTVQYVLIRT
jgi:hypothetical protein